MRHRIFKVSVVLIRVKELYQEIMNHLILNLRELECMLYTMRPFLTVVPHSRAYEARLLMPKKLQCLINIYSLFSLTLLNGVIQCAEYATPGHCVSVHKKQK